MGCPLRTMAGGLVYHALNRANRRATLFAEPGDYDAFLKVLGAAQAKYSVRLLAYCLMPKQWHLVLWPEKDGDLARFVGWLTLTHTQRWHAFRGTVGSGHLYQGRFKSFPIEADEHVWTVCRYVERNALRAGLVERAEAWPYGSLAQRLGMTDPTRPTLAEPPLPFPREWVAWVNAPQTLAEEEAIRRCARRGQPYGNATWLERTVEGFGLQTTLRRRGRPGKPAGPPQPMLFDEKGS